MSSTRYKLQRIYTHTHIYIYRECIYIYTHAYTGNIHTHMHTLSAYLRRAEAISSLKCYVDGDKVGDNSKILFPKA